MLGLLFRFFLIIAVHVLVPVFWLLLGVFISMGIRLTPFLFQLSVLATRWVLEQLDRHLENRLAGSVLLALLSAGGLWALVGLLTPWMLTLALGLRPIRVCAPLVVVGFGFGLACGVHARRLPDRRPWTIAHGLQMGENTR